MKKTSTIIAFGLALILALSTFTGCSGNVDKGNYSGQVAATIGDDTIYLDEANFFLRYNQWNLEAYYWEYYQYMGYSNMWEAAGDSNKTMDTTLKQQVMNELLETRLLIQHAADYNVSLEDEDLEMIAEAARDIRADFHEDFFKYANVTEEQLLQWLSHNALAQKVNMAAKATATVSVDPKDYEVYTVRYIRIPDDEDTTDAVDTAKAEAEYVVKHVQEDGEDMDEVLLQFGGTTTVESFLLSDEEPTADAARIGKTLKTGEIVMEHVEGTSSSAWYVVYCDSDHDEKASAEKKEALEDEQRDEFFEGLYAQWLESAPAFEVKDCYSELVVSEGTMIFVEATTEAVTTTEAPEAESSTGD